MLACLRMVRSWQHVNIIGTKNSFGLHCVKMFIESDFKSKKMCLTKCSIYMNSMQQLKAVGAV